MAASDIELLSAPYTLFPLSRPLISQSRSNTGSDEPIRPCFMSLVKSTSARKRKRVLTEVAACVDGEGVNIYDVAAGQIISSYAVPLSTRFSCPPASVRSKSTRRSYASVSHPRKQILCWEESIRSSDLDVATDGEVKSFSCSNGNSLNVVFLQEISSKVIKTKKDDGDASFDILVVHADAELRCYSPNLQIERWSFKLQSHLGGPKKVIYTATCTVSTAKKSILSNRPEVLLGNADPDDLILLTISAAPPEVNYSIDLYLVPISTTRGPSHLIRFSISLDETGKLPPAFSVHFPTGTLHCITGGKLSSYTLSTITPSITSIISVSPTLNPVFRASFDSSETLYPLFSILNVSSSTVLVSTPDHLSLFETKYSSLQARVFYSPSATVNSITSQGDPTARGDFLYLSVYVHDIGLVLGYSHKGIVAVQLSQPERKSRSQKGGLLIDSICRGVGSLSMDSHHEDYAEILRQLQRKANRDTGEKRYNADYISETIIPKISSEKFAMMEALSDLRRCKSAGDARRFEKSFADYVGVNRHEKDSSLEEGKFLELHISSKKWTRKDAEKDVQMTNGVANHGNETSRQLDANTLDLPEFITPKSEAWQSIPKSQRKTFQWRNLSQEFVTTVLGMIFALEKESGKLKLTFFPPNVIKYLVESGNFSLTLLSVACRRQRQQWVGTREEVAVINEQASVGHGQFVDCLIEYDVSLKHLAWFLREAGDISIGEVIRAVKVVLERLNNESRSLNLLTAPPAEEEDEERLLQQATREAEDALERASKALEETAVLEEVLRLALRRLNNFPPGTIIQELRSGLQGEDLIGLIRILRKEMVVDREGSDEYEGEGALEAVDFELVCNLLTCALDAVGLAGLILSNDTVVGQRKSSFNINLDRELDELDFRDPEDNGELLVDSLYEVVSKAVSALEEAATLAGLLRELCRHAGGIKSIMENNVSLSENKKAKKSKAKTPIKEISRTMHTTRASSGSFSNNKYLFHYKDKSQVPGKPVPLSASSRPSITSTNPTIAPPETKLRQELAMLPLAVPPRSSLAKGEVRLELGGEVVKRSARDMANRESKKIGEYRIEKFVI